MRAQVEVSKLIRKIEFTETIKRRMIDQIKDKVEAVMRFQRQIAYIERQPGLAADLADPVADLGDLVGVLLGEILPALARQLGAALEPVRREFAA